MTDLQLYKTRLRERLIARRGHYIELIRPGLSRSWLSKFATRERDNPTLDQLELLQTALDETEPKTARSA